MNWLIEKLHSLESFQHYNITLFSQKKSFFNAFYCLSKIYIMYYTLYLLMLVHAAILEQIQEHRLLLIAIIEINERRW